MSTLYYHIKHKNFQGPYAAFKQWDRTPNLQLISTAFQNDAHIVLGMKKLPLDQEFEITGKIVNINADIPFVYPYRWWHRVMGRRCLFSACVRGISTILGMDSPHRITGEDCLFPFQRIPDGRIPDCAIRAMGKITRRKYE